jgi:hypothetical protein
MAAMVGDACLLQSGYDRFSERRMRFIAELKERHGVQLFEFLDYFVSRDKFVDAVGIQSDIIVLHYKFSNNGFAPRRGAQGAGTTNIQPNVPLVQIQPQTSVHPSEERRVSYADISRMPLEERSAYLSSLRAAANPAKNQDMPRVPNEWSLPKVSRVGERSGDEQLSPVEFSRRLAGGRAGGIEPMANP